MGLSLLAKIGVFCFVEWAIIHVAACVLILAFALDDSSAGLGEMHTMVLGGMTPGLKKEFLDTTFPKYTNRLFIQHGLNLGWAGLWSFLVAYVVYYQESATSGLHRYVWLLSVVVLLFDWGYLIAVDIPSLGEPPGEAQTFICSIGSALVTYDAMKQGKVPTGEAYKCMAFSLLLALAGVANQVAEQGGLKTEL